MSCCHAKKDAWAASTFHGNCDDKGPNFTIIQVSLRSHAVLISVMKRRCAAPISSVEGHKSDRYSKLDSFSLRHEKLSVAWGQALKGEEVGGILVREVSRPNSRSLTFRTPATQAKLSDIV